MEPLCRLARRHLVKAALCYDKGHVEAWHECRHQIRAPHSGVCANVAPKENPVTIVLPPNRSRSNSSSITVSSTIRATLISNRFEFVRSDSDDRPVPRWSQ